MVPNSDYCNCVVSCAQEQIEYEEQEVAVVFQTKAVVHPGAVVVHHEDAPIADVAVVSASWLHLVTNFARPFPELFQLVHRFVAVHQHFLDVW